MKIRLVWFSIHAQEIVSKLQKHLVKIVFGKKNQYY